MEDRYDSNKHLQSFVSKVFSLGYQIEHDCFNFIKKLSNDENLENILERLIVHIDSLPNKPLFVTKQMLEHIIQEMTKKTQTQAIAPTQPYFQPFAKDVPSDIQILLDPTQRESTDGNLSDYLDLFQNRFSRISTILQQRLDVKNATTIQIALNAPLNSKVKIKNKP